VGTDISESITSCWNGFLRSDILRLLTTQRGYMVQLDMHLTCVVTTFFPDLRKEGFIITLTQETEIHLNYKSLSQRIPEHHRLWQASYWLKVMNIPSFLSSLVCS
jgi:hypothetical protein